MHLTKPFVLVTAVVAAITASVRRRRAQSDADALWREATADASN